VAEALDMSQHEFESQAMTFMNAEKDLVSIIVPVKNELEHIERLVRSIYAQNYKPLEVVIVDGGSRDGTLDILHKLKAQMDGSEFNMKVLREEDYGRACSVPNARNIGIVHSRGRNIVFLEGDMELLEPDLIGEVKKALETHMWVAVLAASMIDSSVEEALIAEVSAWYSGRYPYSYCAVRREVTEKRMFDPTIAPFEQVDFFDDYLASELKIVPYESRKKIGRHEPHTLAELARQQLWYGRTAWTYFAKHLSTKSMRMLVSPTLPIVPVLLAGICAALSQFALSLVLVLLYLYRRFTFSLLIPPQFRKFRVFILVTFIDSVLRPVAYTLGLLYGAMVRAVNHEVKLSRD